MAISNKLVTPPFRASYVHLIEPKPPAAGAEPVFSMAVVLPKDDPEVKKFMKKLKALQDQVAKDKFGKLPKTLKRGIKDGDNLDSEKEHPEWEGCYVFTVKSKTQPGIIGSDLQPIMEEDKLYSGAEYRVSLSMWAWSHATGGKGISYNLDNVMWVKDGDRFDNRSAATDDFADYASEAVEEEDGEEEVDFD